MNLAGGNFLRHELECHGDSCCNHDCIVSSLLLAALELLRVEFAEPYTPECVYRCPIHNAAVGGSPTSQHIEGTAADIHLDQLSPGWTVDLMANAAEDVLQRLDIPGGIGKYNWGIHIDVRKASAPHRWDNR